MFNSFLKYGYRSLPSCNELKDSHIVMSRIQIQIVENVEVFLKDLTGRMIDVSWTIDYAMFCL